MHPTFLPLGLSLWPKNFKIHEAHGRGFQLSYVTDPIHVLRYGVYAGNDSERSRRWLRRGYPKVTHKCACKRVKFMGVVGPWLPFFNFNQFHLNSAASPCSPGLNFFVVHQRTAGLPREIHKVFAFCLLPSRQAATLCHQMDQVPVWGLRRSRFREGMSHGLFSSQKCETCGTFIFFIPGTPGTGFKVQLQPPC